MITFPYDKNCISSEVENTLTSGCDLSRPSFDQREQFIFKAKAKYAVSFESGEIIFARWKKPINSVTGTNMIRASKMADTWWKSSSDSPAFAEISSLCFSNSSSKNSGAYSCRKSKKNRCAVCPCGEINAAIKILASTTSSIQNAGGCIFLNLSCRDLFTFLPISKANFSASFSESVDLATMERRRFSWTNFWRIDSLATSDQLISGHWSISRFISCGTAKVKVGMDNHLAINARNTLNALNAQQVYKLFVKNQVKKELIPAN